MSAQLRAALDRKRLNTLAARAALLGVTLQHLEGDFVPNLFVVSRWSLTREFTDMDAVEKWIDVVGGKQKTECQRTAAFVAAASEGTA